MKYSCTPANCVRAFCVLPDLPDSVLSDIKKLISPEKVGPHEEGATKATTGCIKNVTLLNILLSYGVNLKYFTKINIPLERSGSELSMFLLLEQTYHI